MSRHLSVQTYICFFLRRFVRSSVCIINLWVNRMLGDELDYQVFESRRGQYIYIYIFVKLRERLRDPPTLPFNVYRDSFPRVKAAGTRIWLLTFSNFRGYE